MSRHERQNGRESRGDRGAVNDRHGPVFVGAVPVRSREGTGRPGEGTGWCGTGPEAGRRGAATPGDTSASVAMTLPWHRCAVLARLCQEPGPRPYGGVKGGHGEGNGC